VKLVSPSNVTKKMSWLPLKQINIRLTQGKSNISDDTAVPFLVNVWTAGKLQQLRKQWASFQWRMIILGMLWR
jgi:hypothetical protein